MFIENIFNAYKSSCLFCNNVSNTVEHQKKISKTVEIIRKNTQKHWRNKSVRKSRTQNIYHILAIERDAKWALIIRYNSDCLLPIFLSLLSHSIHVKSVATGCHVNRNKVREREKKYGFKKMLICFQWTRINKDHSFNLLNRVSIATISIRYHFKLEHTIQVL